MELIVDKKLFLKYIYNNKELFFKLKGEYVEKKRLFPDFLFLLWMASWDYIKLLYS